jgi:Flp pilus assembly protein CpaB
MEELEFKDPSHRRRRLMIIVGVVTALAAGVLAYSLGMQGSASAEPPPVPQRAIVVAVQALPARSVLQEGDVAVRLVPDDASLLGALTSAEEAVGHVTTIPVLIGQVFYPNLLVGAGVEGQLAILPASELILEDSPYWRAVSVSVPRERAVGGRITAGQRVDLFSTIQIDILVLDDDGKYVQQPSADGFQSGKSTKITFQDLEVLEVQPEEGIYILKVLLTEAEEVYHVASVAPNSFSIALRPDGDVRSAETLDFGQTNDRLIVQYLFPFPQLLQIGDSTIVGPPAVEPDPDDVEPEPEPEPEPDDADDAEEVTPGN